MKLLIVDDQRSVHLYLQKAIDLPALGFSEVLHAESGTQALELLRRCHPDVMILDIQMPDMNGIAGSPSAGKNRATRNRCAYCLR